MVAYLQGRIIQKDQQNIILLTDKIGYLVLLNKKIAENLKINQEIELFIYTKVREDEISLFGFQNIEELDFFKQLISVNGIGPKTALEILSQDTEQVKNAIVQENISFLSKIPGIGKKSAERIIVELKSKVVPSELKVLDNQLEQTFEEAMSALMGLGYQRSEIYRVLKNSSVTIDSTEEAITFFLKNI